MERKSLEEQQRETEEKKKEKRDYINISAEVAKSISSKLLSIKAFLC